MKLKERNRRRELILKAYAETGSIKGTRRKLGYSIGSIRRVLRGQDQLPAIRHPAKRVSKLEPFKAIIQRLVVEDRLTAVLALDELRELGFDGSYSTLKRYVRMIRPGSRLRVTTRVEHPPGEEGQVDWSPYKVSLAGEWVVVRGFSHVLPFSRWMFVRFTLDERLETLIEKHDEMFTLLGAVPHRLSYDNMTTVGRHVGPGKVWLNPRFEAYAERYGFQIHIIDPGCPNQHASVERPFHYIENNCLRRRRFRFDSLDELNQHAIWWCNEVANTRIHGTTRERPVDRLLRERAYLKPLPWERPEPYSELFRSVGTDFCVAVNTNRYSVPPTFVGRPVTVRAYAERLEFLVDADVVAVHPVCRERHQRKVLPEHEAAFKKCTPSRRLLEQAFLRLGPEAQTYYEGLKAHRGRGAGYHLKRILALADRYGISLVSGAMDHSARFGNYSAEAVARVIAGRGLRRQPQPSEHDLPLPPERVRRWLEGLNVDARDLDDYDQMVNQHGVGGSEEDAQKPEQGDEEPKEDSDDS